MTARESHYKGTSKWFVEGSTFAQWKSSSPDSLLWIHGKRTCLSLSHAPIFAEITGFEFAAGAGKSVIWYVHFLSVPYKGLIRFV